MELDRQCRGEGPLDARLWLIAEAPGEAEQSHRRPLIGASGHLLNQLLEGAGIRRSLCRIENVVERRPPANKIEAIPRAEMDLWRLDLALRLSAADPGAVFVPLGNTALAAVMGWQTGNITKWRGTCLRVGSHTVLPSIHPAAVLRQTSLMRRVLVDWGRVAALANGINVAAPERELLVAGRDISWQDAEKELLDDDHTNEPLSIDIETIPDQRRITCVGFAPSATRAITISLYFPDYQSGLCGGTVEHAAALVRAVCETRRPKIVQNGVGYDAPWLRDVLGCALGGRIFDTRWMHHAMYPSDGGDDYSGRSGLVGEDHGLAYLASIYTAEPYWKDEAKAADRLTQLRYNGKDCAVTYEVWERLRDELTERGQWAYYEQAYERLYEVLGDPAHLGSGILVDLVRRRDLLEKLAHKAAVAASALDALAGVRGERIAELVSQTSHGERGKGAAAARKELKELRAASIFGDGGGVSYTKVQRFLVDKCGARLPKKRGSDGKATDEVTLRQLYLKSRPDSPLRTAVPLLLDYRSATKQGTFLAEKNYGSDNRMRSTYTMLPETGRLSSQRNHFGLGGNLQNQDREIRSAYVADEGTVMLAVDLSSAEDRVVKMDLRDERMRKLARTPPWELKMHRYNAALMFNKPESAVTKEDYDLAKRTGHGTNYFMQPPKMSETWLKNSDGRVVKTPEECKTLQQLFITRCMPLLPDYWMGMRAAVMRHRCVSNVFGRVLDLTHERLDDETYRRCYAFKPQSTVGMLVNWFGLVPVWEWLRREGAATGARLCLQLHDALYFCVPPQHVWTVASTVQAMLERPVRYYGHEMTIPVEFKVSRRWDGDEAKEWTRLPGRAEMEGFAASLLE